jgi:oxygen-dependent protoporphyrinogen oxidase
MEREHGSLIKAMRARKADPSVASGPPGHLTSFRQGLGTLATAMASRFEVVTGAKVTSLTQGWRLGTADKTFEADAVVLATPAWASAALLEAIASDAAAALFEIPYVPVAVICQAFPRAGWTQPPGFGVLVPRAQGMDVLGTLFTSNLFPQHVPDDQFLVRSMVGGAIKPELLDLDDQALVAKVRAANEHLLGPLPQASRTTVFRHPRGIPQYTLGHRDRVARVRAAEAGLPGLFVTGNHLEGVAIKDCVRDGERTAKRVAAFLAGHGAE